jgi:hypothetical protein
VGDLINRVRFLESNIVHVVLSARASEISDILLEYRILLLLDFRSLPISFSLDSLLHDIFSPCWTALS